MYKLIKINCFLFFIVLLAGCATTSLNIPVTTPGEMNLKGISKIAFFDFNSVESNEKLGVYAADKDTLKLAQRLIAAEFYKTDFYKVVDLNIEKYIKNINDNANYKNRFDAVIYGTLWWQTTDEHFNKYYKKFNLETWHNQKYHTEILGQTVEATAKLTEREEEALAMIPYRAKSAVLMMNLSIYKLDSSGQIVKLAETLELGRQVNIIDNGKYTGTSSIVNKADKSRKSKLKNTQEEKSFWEMETEVKKTNTEVDVTQISNSIPTELYNQVSLVSELVKDFISNIAPHQEIFTLYVTPDDFKLNELLKYSDFYIGRSYIINKLLVKNNEEAANLLNDLDIKGGAKCVLKSKIEIDKMSAEEINTEVNNYIEDNADNLFYFAICEEAMNRTEEALHIYDILFNISPNKQYADGISRCLFSLDMRERVNEKTLNKEDATESNKLK